MVSIVQEKYAYVTCEPKIGKKKYKIKYEKDSLDIDVIYNLKFRKIWPNSTDKFTTKLNAMHYYSYSHPGSRCTS